MKDQEIELKLKYKNRKKIVDKLKKIGAKYKERFVLHDTYFSFQKDMANAKSFLRIREKGNKKELTFKGNRKDKNNIWKRTEINTKIEEPNKIIKIISCLGLNKIKENKSEREIFMLRNLEIAFIDFIRPKKFSIIELEGTFEKIEQTMEKLGNLVERIDEEPFKVLD
jgi:predicted adenylyl cyclase CyaB